LRNNLVHVAGTGKRGKKLDARTDIFSFGAVLYEILTGRRAFVGDSNRFDPVGHCCAMSPKPAAAIGAGPSAGAPTGSLRPLPEEGARPEIFNTRAI